MELTHQPQNSFFSFFLCLNTHKARESIRQIIKLPLYGLTEEEAENENFFDHELAVMDESLKG